MIPPPDFVALGAVGTVRDMRSIVQRIAPRSTERRPDAVRAADEILRRATAEDLAWLDDRRAYGYEYGPWEQIRPADLGTPPLLPDSLSAPVAALASMHPNGYVREAAVRLLATRDDGAELPYLLLRVNDWVSEVRAPATEAVYERLVPSYSKHFVACFALVEKLRGARRAALDGLFAGVEQLLCGEAAWGALLEALHAPSAAVRRAAARAAVRGGDAVLVLRAATSRDPAVAVIGARAVAATWSDGALREVLPALRRGVSELRWIALAAVCDRLPREAEPLLRDSLLDPSISVRELARYRWDKVGLPSMDFAAFYRECVSAPADLRKIVERAGGSRKTEGQALAVAVRGLAETATAADAPLLAELSRHANAAVRTAAILGLGRSADNAFRDVLAAAMDDPSTRVAAQARRWVKVRLGRAAVRDRRAAR